MKSPRANRFCRAASVLILISVFAACGSSGSGGGGSGGGGNAPATPTGLAATAGNTQVVLTWNASTGATSYTVGRSTTSGGPYTTLATGASSPYTDSAVTNGTAYYYVVSATNANGTSANSSQVAATPMAPTPPPTPTGFMATAGNGQVALMWNSSAGATSYKLGRATVGGGPYTTISSPAASSYTDTTVTNGTTYYYVVAAANTNGTSPNSSQVAATPFAASTAISVNVDVMTDRYQISPYVYGGAFPPDATHITDSGTTAVRWGGNATSTYNWKLGTYNADNDYYFEDFNFGALNNPADSDSVQFINDVKAAGSNPLMTMVMLPWVAQGPEIASPPNYHWSFSVSQDGACSTKTDPHNTDAGINLASDCATTTVASKTQINRAYYPLLDGPPQGGDPANSVYRNQWAAALAAAFGASPHFYDMDNEIDIWGRTHADIHSNPSSYNELRDTYLTEANNLKSWDPAAIRFGPVSCCWFYYWRSATGSSDTSSHGGVDFLPWWLNEVYWRDKIAGKQSLESFDIHAYPDADTAGLTQSQLQALSTRIFRDYWDPTFTSAAQYIVNGGFSMEPLDSKPFRLPRMRAIINSIYPGTSLSVTEWSAAFAGESDFSTALADADAYGILARERVYLSTRWEAPVPANPNYQALKLYTNYDGAHDTFGSISVSATHNADPDLFSVYAATVPGGTSVTLMVLNKDPVNAAQTTFALNGFTPSQVIAYTLSTASPNSIVAGTSHAWSSTMTFAPYSATLLVISGTATNQPAVEWKLNPGTIMVPAGGSVTLNPKLLLGSTGTITLGSPSSDAGITVTVTQSTVSTHQLGSVLVTAGSTPGFYHFSIPASDGTTQGGWIVVGNPAAALAKTAGDAQTGTVGTVLPLDLTVTLTPGSSGGTTNGASVFFTTTAGSLTNVAVGSEKIFTGSKVIAVTDSSGVAKVTLTLPATAGVVTVTAEGPYGLGHPVIPSFTETAQ